MRTRYGISPWIEAVPKARRPDYPRLRGEHMVDVAIVGGGLTGCATAYACAVAGLRPILIEGGRVGQGSTGRSGGLLRPEPGPPFRDVAARHGVRLARHLFDGWRRASLDAAALLRRLTIRCELQPADQITVAPRDGGTLLRREIDARRAASVDGTWLHAAAAGKVSGIDSAGAMKLDGGFTVDPYRACLGVAGAAARRGARLFEQTEVTRVRAGSKRVEIGFDGGVVHASTVVVCTGSATVEFKPLRRHFKPRERYHVLTAPVAAAVRRQLGARDAVVGNTAVPPHLVRWTRDERLVIGGADQKATPARRREAVLVQRTGQLMYETLLLTPAIAGLSPEFGWECPYGETADGIMYIGPHRNYPRHLFGLGGDSLTGAFLAGRLLGRAVLGKTDKGDQAFGWTR